MNKDPNKYYDSVSDTFLAAKFLVGIGLNLKERGYFPETLFFMKLACYC